MVYYFAPLDELVLPVNKKFLPLVTLQASFFSFPLAKLSFSRLRPIQGNSFLRRSVPLLRSAYRYVIFHMWKGLGWVDFAVLVENSAALYCVYSLQSQPFSPAEWMVLEGNIELMLRKFVNLSLTISQGLVAKHHRHVGPLLFHITWDISPSFGLCVLWNPLASSEGPSLRCKLYYPSSSKFTLDEQKCLPDLPSSTRKPGLVKPLSIISFTTGNWLETRW